MSPLVIAISILQAAACVAAGVLLLAFWRAHRHEYLRLWGLSWLALAAHLSFAWSAFVFASSTNGLGIWLRTAAACISLIAAACHLLWLLLGALHIGHPPRLSRRAMTLIFAGASLAAAALVISTVAASLNTRMIVRSGVPIAAGAVTYASFAIIMLRSGRNGRRSGAIILAVASLAFAVMHAGALVAIAYAVRQQVQFPLVEFIGVATLFLQVLMSLGMVVWLLDNQRAAAADVSAALGKAEARLRRLVDHARLVVWEYDSATKRFTYVSPQAERMLGYSLEQWRQPEFWFEHVHPDDRDRARAFSHEQSQRGLEHAFEYRMVRKDGGVVWVRDLTSVDRQDGRVVGLRGVLIDITDRKSVEQDMHHVQQRLTSVVAAAPLMLWAVDRDGRFRLSEGRGLETLGLRPGQVVGQSLMDLYGDHPRIMEIHARAKTGETVSESIELSGMVFDTRVSPVMNAEGEISGVIGVAVDVTQRHRAQEALRRSEEQLRGLFESAVDPLWDWDIASDHCTFSPSWQRLVGYDMAEFDQDRIKWSDLLHPEDRSTVLRHLEATMRDDRAHYEIEYRLRTKDGAWRWVMSRGRVVTRDIDGRPRRMVGSITDITERKEVETALRESEARLRAVIDNAPSIAIQGYDIGGRVLFWNNAAQTIFGWSEREAIGRTLDVLMLDAAGHQHFVQTLKQIERTGQPVTLGDTPFTRRDGSSGWCHSTVFKLPSGPASTFICMDVDISDHKRAEQALERSNDLQRLLLSELDHRVRNNLASLVALIDISARDSRSVPDFAISVRSRVQAMSVVHALLSREHWRSVDLRQLLLTLAPVGAQERLIIMGAPVNIVPRQATALGMVLQELLANSQKYGALSTPGGTVSVTWTLDAAHSDRAARTLGLQWCERGGPEITSPVREGVGTGLIHGLVRTELQGEAMINFERSGASHAMRLTLDAGDAAVSVPMPERAATAAT